MRDFKPGDIFIITGHTHFLMGVLIAVLNDREDPFTIAWNDGPIYEFNNDDVEPWQHVPLDRR